MKATTVPVENAIGKVLCHDVTRIVRGEFKGPVLRKGHVIREADVPTLLDSGNDHVYVMELEEGDVHEDEAGVRLAKAAASTGIAIGGPVESRVDLLAAQDGLLKVNVEALRRLNSVENVVLATLHNDFVVRKGDVVAGTKVVPLVVSETTVRQAEQISREAGGIVKVIPFQKLKAGAVITGSEVAKGRVKDDFEPTIRRKIESLGSTLESVVFVPDDLEAITKAVLDFAGRMQLILVTGGMSVDPDDVTPAAIRRAGAQVVKYGAPVMPGVMFLVGYLDGVPIVGVPACGMFFQTTVLDLVLPRLLAGEKVAREDIIDLGHGGLCRKHVPCHFPNCEFGKG